MTGDFDSRLRKFFLWAQSKPTPISPFWSKQLEGLSRDWWVDQSRSMGISGIDNGPRTQREHDRMMDAISPLLPCNVLEIGGGFGELCRRVMASSMDTFYVLVDLPEQCVAQARHLYRSLPWASVGLGHDEGVFDVVIVPGWDLPNVGMCEFDLVINTRSFMEMDAQCLAFYFREIHRLLRPGGHFYSVNRDKTTKIRDYPFDDKWETVWSKPWQIEAVQGMRETLYRRLG